MTTMKIYDNPCTSMQKNMKHIKSTKVKTIYRIYLFWTKNSSYFLYSKNIIASHICALKKNKLFKPRKQTSRS